MRLCLNAGASCSPSRARHCSPSPSGSNTISASPRRPDRSSMGGHNMTLRQKPPFRGDMVGSLLRSAPVKDARAKVAAGEMTQAELTKIEDEEIRKLVKKQEEVGLQAVTDGEYRRAFWHFDFLDGL